MRRHNTIISSETKSDDEDTHTWTPSHYVVHHSNHFKQGVSLVY